MNYDKSPKTKAMFSMLNLFSFQNYRFAEPEISNQPTLFEPHQNVLLSYNEKEVIQKCETLETKKKC